MKIGIVYPQTELGGDPSAVRDIGLAVESLGFDHLLAYDHVVGAVHEGRDPKLWGPYTERDPFHDPFVMFGYLAGITERIELATGVLILPQRQTVLVAKQAADIDLLSGGRLRLGVGVGWNYVEYDALGEDFSTRGRRADEQIRYLRELWTSETTSFEGRFDQLDRGCIIPRPTRPIPIWIGGFSPAAFRRGGLLGDGFIYAGGIESGLEGKTAVEAELAAAGRPTESFGHDMVLMGSDAAEAKAAADQWREAGGTHLSVVTMGAGLDSTAAHVDRIKDIADALLPAALVPDAPR